MSVRFMDGFDESTPGTALGYLVASSAAKTTLVDHPDGDRQCLVQTSTTSSSHPDLPVESAPRYKASRSVPNDYGDRFGFGVLVSAVRSLSPSTPGVNHCNFVGIETQAGDPIIQVGRASSGVAVVNDNLTDLPFELSVYHFIELEIDKVGLVARAWLNNELLAEIALTGSEGALQYWFGMTTVNVNVPVNTALVRFNDLYESDSQGAENTRRLGKVKVVTRLPDADFAAEFLRDTGDSNASQVRTNDGDASYVYSNQVGTVDLYSNNEALPFPDAPVLAVSVSVSARKEGPDARSVVPMVQVDGADEVGERIDLQIGSYRTGTAMFNVNPKTGQAWDNVSAASAKFGQMLVL